MYDLLKYLDTEIINKIYCDKFNIHRNTFYIRTEYQGTISIQSENPFDFYDLLIESKLLDDFNTDLNTTFKRYNIDVNPNISSGSIINYSYIRGDGIIQLEDVYFTYASQCDPRINQEDKINKKLGAFCEKKLFDLTLVDELNLTHEIIHNLKRDNCTIINNTYEKLTFMTQGFLIKAMQDIYSTNELAHEGYILHELNKCGPNFPKFINFDRLNYVFRAAPVQDHWDNPVNYLIIERVMGVPLKDFLLKSSKAEILNVLTQIFYALYDAQKIKFTHYDLHIDNILIKKLKIPLEIEYSRGEVQTENLVTFIDFEFSYIKIGDYNLGASQICSNIYNRNFWLHDIFKFLMSLYKFFNHHLEKGRTSLKPIFDIIFKLIKIIISSDFDIKQWNKFYKINEFMNLRFKKYDITFESFLQQFESLTN